MLAYHPISGAGHTEPDRYEEFHAHLSGQRNLVS